MNHIIYKSICCVPDIELYCSITGRERQCSPANTLHCRTLLSGSQLIQVSTQQLGTLFIKRGTHQHHGRANAQESKLTRMKLSVSSFSLVLYGR